VYFVETHKNDTLTEAGVSGFYLNNKKIKINKINKKNTAPMG
jgi:hypothetical protein